VKSAIVSLIHHSEENLHINLSTYIAEKLHHDYNYISNLFSEVEGTTIEKYFIAQKIEKVKELLKYEELSLSQIADKLGYSSVAYLSNQFKKQTGLTPSFYKTMKQNNRNNIDEL
jgi:YesN/AraC family two-component response regulator